MSAIIPSARAPGYAGAVVGRREAEVQLPRASRPAVAHRLLLVDDDALFCRQLARGLERHGFEVTATAERSQALQLLHELRPAVALLELRLAEDSLAEQSGLDLLQAFRQVRPDLRTLIVTGSGSIATAVTAIKAGADDYLVKPIRPDQVAAVLRPGHGASQDLRIDPMSADRLRWEYIQRIFQQCERNVSETARRLKMHRRSLQRMLQKRPPPE